MKSFAGSKYEQAILEVDTESAKSRGDDIRRAAKAAVTAATPLAAPQTEAASLRAIDELAGATVVALDQLGAAIRLSL
jgi:hypothetical protein